MKTPFLAILVAICAAYAFGQVDKKKPEIVVAEDGFPAGHGTPEGVACDFARAFISRNVGLFKSTCVEPFGGEEKRKNYNVVLDRVSASVEAEANKAEPSPGGPKKITKVYAARHLSRNGPASAGYAMYSFHDIMFVDITVELHSGKIAQNRTMVLKKPDGKWYVHPAPHTAGLLSTGLNQEAPSTKDFTQVYIDRKQKNEQGSGLHSE